MHPRFYYLLSDLLTQGAKGLLILLLIGIGNSPSYSQQKSFFEYPSALVTTPIDTARIKQQFLEAGTFMQQYPDSALRIFNRLLDQSRQIGYPYGIAKNLLAKSLIYSYKNPESAIHMLQPLYTLLSSRLPELLPEFHTRLANYYSMLGYADTAIQHAHVALQIIQAHPEEKGITQLAPLYLQLGALYMKDTQDIPTAISYLEKAIATALGQKEQKNWLIKAYIGLGGAYANQSRFSANPAPGYRKGLSYINKGIDLISLSGDSSQLGMAYSNMGLIYSWLNQLDSAEMYIEAAIRLSESPGSLREKIHAYLVLGVAYQRNHDFPKAEAAYKKAIDMSSIIHYRQMLLHGYKALSDLYILSKKYDQSLIYLQQYTFLKDSLINEEKVNATTNLELKYRSAEKDRELAWKSLALSQHRHQLREKNTWLIAGGTGSLLLAGFLLLLWRYSRHRRLRAEEQQQLWKQGEEIRNLKAMVNGEEKERARIGRELHDGIVGQLAAAKINFTMIQSKYPLPELHADFKDALNYLDETSQELRKTAHNLMPGMLTEQGLLVAVDAFCEKTATFTGIEIDVHQDGILPRLDIDFELSLYRMVQELMQNIIKHANATRALVQLDYHEPVLILTVEDNGIGITAEQATSGMGLTNLRTRVNALQGNMELSGNKGEGTSVYIEFDISLINRANEI